NELSGGELDYDQDGNWAARGEVADTLLKRLMDHFFIKKVAPKTTGREDFGQQMVKKIIKAKKELALDKYDLVATVTAYTAYSIVDAYHRFIDGKIDQIIVGGGGSYNPVLLDMLRDYAREILSSGVQIITQEDLGYSSEAKEAVAFAVLGYQALRGKNNNLPRVTGASRDVIMGEIVPGSDFYRYFDWQA
ncbi:MAG: anhydro-N-acetylmuramic acid kinase, partial [Halanaerobiales bacterium]